MRSFQVVYTAVVSAVGDQGLSLENLEFVVCVLES